MRDDTKPAFQESALPISAASSVLPRTSAAALLSVPDDAAIDQRRREVAELYQQKYGRLVVLARSMSSMDDAPDLVHDAFAAYWLKIAGGSAQRDSSGIREPEAMLVKMLKDAARTIMRCELRRLRTVAIMVTGPVRAVKRWMEPGKRAEDTEIRSIVAHELRAMRTTEREVFVLVHHLELPFSEIGQMLGIEAGSARMALSRAGRKLRKRLTAAGYVRNRSSIEMQKRGAIT